MSPPTAPVVSQLRQLIYYHLDNESPENANFLAGRLQALDSRNPDSSHLYALTYLRLRRFKSAYDQAHKYGLNGKNLGCAYTFALACQELGRFSEGITALQKAMPLWIGRNHWNKHSESSRRHLPDAAAAYNLLGKLWRGHGDLRKAGEYLAEAHKANPFIWDSFQGLCDIGAKVDVASIFRMTPEMYTSAAPAAASQVPNGNKDASGPLPQAVPGLAAGQNVLTPSNDPFNPTTTKNASEWSFQNGAANFFLPKMKSRGIFGSPPKLQSQPSWETPTANGTNEEADVEMGGLGGLGSEAQAALNDAPTAPIRRSKTLQRLGFESTKDSSRLQAERRTHGRTQSEVTDAEEASSHESRAANLHKRTLSGHSSTATSDASIAQPRRSNRLFSQITGSKTSTRPTPTDSASLVASKREGELRKAKATGTKGRGPSTVGRVVSGNRKVMPPSTSDAKEHRAPSRNSVPAPPLPPQKPAVDAVVVPDTTAIESLLASFKQLAIGTYALSRYDSPAAMEAFKSIPTALRETPWVLAQMGKAHYEAADYVSSEQCFARMMKLQPTRIEDTEVYSSVLWQLKKPVQLAFLAHTLRELDFDAPQTWCAVGNAFSLNREHEQAIACFRRATQLDPKFAYAYTLMGHELLTNEEFDAALGAYRKGVGGEKRGYGGWYGLGKCYERMGKYEEAERHYRVAAGINPANAVLVVCIGVVLERMRHPREALAQYAHALSLSPNSALARFKKARVLMALRHYNEALTELEILKDVAPEEANVFFLLGKCYKGLGDRPGAVRAFTTALNLDAKAAQYIKDAMEALDETDEEDDDDD